jgi:hypothetical protein
MKILACCISSALILALGTLVASAQSPAIGLSGMQGGGQGGLFTIPRVDAHVRGIPGVTRPMLMAGPVGGGMGGQGGGMQVNPNWTGAAAMFMPQLLSNNGGGNAVGGNANATATPGFRVGSTGRPAVNVVPGGPAVSATPAESPRTVAPVVASQPVPRTLPPVDPVLVEERLLAYQREQARNGSPSAQWALSRRYAEGRGVEASPGMARAWMEAAARSGSEEAKAALRE